MHTGILCDDNQDRHGIQDIHEPLVIDEIPRLVQSICCVFENAEQAMEQQHVAGEERSKDVASPREGFVLTPLCRVRLQAAIEDEYGCDIHDCKQHLQSHTNCYNAMTGLRITGMLDHEGETYRVSSVAMYQAQGSHQ